MKYENTKFLIVGTSGQVGSALVNLLSKQNGAKNIQTWSRADFDLANPDSLPKDLAFRPDVIVNTAAYTHVDLAEKNQNLARKINVDAVQALADLAGKLECLFVHFSSDYVYSGLGEDPQVESDDPSPQNFYGLTKWESEKAVMDSQAKQHLIFRTSWVHSYFGRNFVNTMLKMQEAHEVLKIVNDQVGAPTYAPHLAANVLVVIKKYLDLGLSSRQNLSGIYNICARESCSWFEFACEIFVQAQSMGLIRRSPKCLAISSQEFPQIAKRPLNSRMSLDKIKDKFGVVPESWRSGLEQCLLEIRAHQSLSK